jgi:hypothetical protein
MGLVELGRSLGPPIGEGATLQHEHDLDFLVPYA